MESTRSSSSFTDRLIGILTFKAPIYREVAEDPAATQQALIVVVVSAILSALLYGGSTAATGGRYPIFNALGALFGTLIGWAIGAWFLSFVATKFFNGRTNFQEMLRVTGYVAVFDILFGIPIIGFLAGILHLVGIVIGIREAAEITTTQAVGVGIITVVLLCVVLLVFAILLGLCLAPFAIAGAMFSSNP
ncbi:MAG: YIP1 family protein [Chloroflexia bacterium]